MRVEPVVKRAVAFFDGQNLFYAARNAFDFLCLAEHKERGYVG
jgi:hypothetical protein